MSHLGRTRQTLFLVIAALALSACFPAPMNDLELLAEIEDFEAAIAGQQREVVQRLLREQASAFKGRVVQVPSGVVASAYARDNQSNIYFGVNYEENDHLYLSQIDPQLHEALKNHRHWVSIAVTYPSRQLSFELPVDREAFERLQQGRELSFSCRIAALIRGKSVYCAPVVLEVGH